MELGKVCIDSLMIFVPNYLIEGGMGVIGGEEYLRKLQGGWKSLTGRKRDDGKLELMGEGGERKWGRSINHPADYEGNLWKVWGDDVEKEMMYGNGVSWRIGSKNLGLDVRNDSGARRREGGVKGLFVKVSSKHLGVDYFDGISKRNWDVAIGRVEEELDCRFVDGLLDGVVDRVDVKSDVRLRREDWEKMKRMIESSIREGMDVVWKGEKMINRFGEDGSRRGFSGIRFGGKRASTAAQFPLFTIYGKKEQYLEMEKMNGRRFRALMDWVGYGEDDLEGIYRFEYSCCGQVMVKQHIGSGKRSVRDILFEEDDIRYVKAMRWSMSKWLDIDGEFGLKEKAKVKIVGDGKKLGNANDVYKIEEVWNVMVMEWELEKRSLNLQDKSESQIKREEAKWWSRENIDVVVDRVLDRKLAFLRDAEGLGKSDDRYNNIQTTFKRSKKSVAKSVYELGLVSRGIGGGKKDLGSEDRFGLELEGMSMRRLMRKVGLDLFDGVAKEEKRWESEDRSSKKGLRVFGRGKGK